MDAWSRNRRSRRRCRRGGVQLRRRLLKNVETCLRVSVKRTNNRFLWSRLGVGAIPDQRLLEPRVDSILATAGLSCFIAVPIKAQPPSAPLAFEAASVKKHNASDRRVGLPQFFAGGRFTSTGIPVRLLIAVAYNLPFQSVQLTGGPDWIGSREDGYDIEAKAETGAIPAEMSPKARADKMRLMLQTLLADRFKLTIQREMKELAGIRPGSGQKRAEAA
jgi:hypothetical protein